MKKLYFDDSMGAAGDMISAALMDLFDQPEEVADEINKAIKEAGLSDVVAKILTSYSQGIKGLDFDVEVNGESEHPEYEDQEHDDHDHDHPYFHDHPHRWDDWDHDHPHFHDHPHRHDEWDHDHPHFHGHPHRHDDWDHHPEHRRECRRPRRCGPKMGMGPFMPPLPFIQGDVEINVHLHFGDEYGTDMKPKKKHHHHHHRHHRKHRRTAEAPKGMKAEKDSKNPRRHHKTRRPYGKRKNINVKKDLSMHTGKDHFS